MQTVIRRDQPLRPEQSSNVSSGFTLNLMALCSFIVRFPLLFEKSVSYSSVIHLHLKRVCTIPSFNTKVITSHHVYNGVMFNAVVYANQEIT